MPELELNELLSGAIGALGALILTIVYSEIQTWRNRGRERQALLLLLDAEVSSHIKIYERLKAGWPRKSQETEPGNIELTTPRTQDWDDSRARLAQLICADHMRAIVIYYKMLRDIIASTSPEETKVERIEQLRVFADGLNKQAEAIRDKGKKYLKQLPDYDKADF